MAGNYGTQYALNMREPICRVTLRQFIEMALVRLNPGNPGRPAAAHARRMTQ